MPSEALERSPTENSADDFEDLEDRAEAAAHTYGFTIPEAGQPALERLIYACKDYAQKVDRQNKSPRAQVDEKFREKSDLARRRAHNTLCQMLLGREYNNTDSHERVRISDFAVTVAGMDEYIGTF